MNKNRKYIIILISLFFIFTLFIELRYYSNRLDFFWNYNFGIQISNGLLPYNDFNIVTTPLLAFIVGLFLKIFGNRLLVYAILMAIGKVSLAYVISKVSVLISKKKDDKEKLSIFTISFLLANLLMYRYYFEYNYLSILFLVIIIYLDCLKSNKFNNILIGVLAALAILSKYSVGAVILLFVLIEPIIFKEDKKIICYRLFGAFIPSFIFIIYLLLTNSFNNFISYTILGLKEFSNNKYNVIQYLNEIISIGNLRYAIIYIIILLISFYYLLKKIYIIVVKKKKVSLEEKKVLFYSLSAFSCFYPIMDDTHFIPSILPLIILESNSIYRLLNKNIDMLSYRVKHVLKICSIIVIVFISVFPLIKYIEIPLNLDKYYVIINDEFKHLKGLVISNSIKIYLEDMIKFEQEQIEKGNIVMYLDKEAVLFHIPQDIYYKDFDLFMKGNFGENGEDRLIEKIKNSSNTIYLIKSNYKKEQGFITNQIPEKVIDYVIDNYKNIGERTLFSIYSK